MKKDLAMIGGLFLLVAGIVIFGKGFSTGSFITSKNQSTKSASSSNSVTTPKESTHVVIGNFKIDAIVADTADERKRGLGERDDLPISEGMLFVFDKSDSYAIWMKDMKFPIDIIWVGEDKKIVDIAENAVPEPKKKDDELKIYRPKAEAKYILEINAGLVRLHNLQVGDTVNSEL